MSLQLPVSDFKGIQVRQMRNTKTFLKVISYFEKMHCAGSSYVKKIYSKY